MIPTRWAEAGALAVTLAVVATACGDDAGLSPARTVGPCPVELEDLEAGVVECGHIVAPLDHADPGAGTVRLAYARVAAFDGIGQDPPLFWLEGGPGVPAIETRLADTLRALRPTLGLTRDIVLSDPRGTGASEPRLDCPEADPVRSGELERADDVAAMSAAALEQMRRCRLQLEQHGVDPWHFNGVWSALDVDWVRRGLGYDQVLLYGTSWGSLTAQRVLADAPGAVAGAALDGVVPAATRWLADAPANAEAALERVLATCAAMGACARSFPAVDGAMDAVMERLATEPIALDVPVDGETRTWLVTPLRFANLVRGLLYTADGAGTVPRLLTEVAAGETGLLRLLMVRQSDDPLLEGAYWSAVCAEYDASEIVAGGAATTTAFGQALATGLPVVEGVCGTWGQRRIPPPAHGLLRTQVPVLLLSGEFDPITPARNAALVGQGATTAHDFLLPGVAHGAVGTPCGRELLGAFLASPAFAPRPSCLADAGFRFDPGREQFFGGDGLFVVPLPIGWTSRQTEHFEVRFSNQTRASLAVGVLTAGDVPEGIEALRREAFPDFVGPTSTRLRQDIGLRQWTEEVRGLTAGDVLVAAGTWYDGRVWLVAIRGPLADVDREYAVYREAVERFGIVATSAP